MTVPAASDVTTITVPDSVLCVRGAWLLPAASPPSLWPTAERTASCVSAERKSAVIIVSQSCYSGRLMTVPAASDVTTITMPDSVLCVRGAWLLPATSPPSLWPTAERTASCVSAERKSAVIIVSQSCYSGRLMTVPAVSDVTTITVPDSVLCVRGAVVCCHYRVAVVLQWSINDSARRL
ncbi:hypothetical protein ACJJTC_001467 [Scirpophaga incertulas]